MGASRPTVGLSRGPIDPGHIGELEQIESALCTGRGALAPPGYPGHKNAATNDITGTFSPPRGPNFGKNLQKTVEVNIRGYFLTCHARRQAEIKKRWRLDRQRRIGQRRRTRFFVQQGIYSITKAAVISMTKAFAVECPEQGVRCNALYPGLTDTKFASVW